MFPAAKHTAGRSCAGEIDGRAAAGDTSVLTAAIDIHRYPRAWVDVDACAIFYRCLLAGAASKYAGGTAGYIDGYLAFYCAGGGRTAVKTAVHCSCCLMKFYISVDGRLVGAAVEMTGD